MFENIIAVCCGCCSVALLPSRVDCTVRRGMRWEFSASTTYGGSKFECSLCSQRFVQRFRSSGSLAHIGVVSAPRKTSDSSDTCAASGTLLHGRALVLLACKATSPSSLSSVNQQNNHVQDHDQRQNAHTYQRSSQFRKNPIGRTCTCPLTNHSQDHDRRQNAHTLQKQTVPKDSDRWHMHMSTDKPRSRPRLVAKCTHIKEADRSERFRSVAQVHVHQQTTFKTTIGGKMHTHQRSRPFRKIPIGGTRTCPLTNHLQDHHRWHKQHIQIVVEMVQELARTPLQR